MNLTHRALFAIVLTVTLGPLPQVSAQSRQDYATCSMLVRRQGEELDSGKDWPLLVALAREYITKCADIDTAEWKQRFAIKNIGMGLVEQKNYEDAIPVLRRCVSLYPDYGNCWFELGLAYSYLKRFEDAKTALQKAIDTGGYNVENAAVVENSKKLLAMIERDSASGSVRNAGKQPAHVFGTGFYVSREGHILTNNHVVADCKKIATRDGETLRLISRNTHADLALLKIDNTPKAISSFRLGPPPRLGDAVLAFGFPLPDLLSSEGNVSTGIISATSGLQDDVRFIQISAPVQPGNSGGPLLDLSGHVIGVVVAKLDAVAVARATGDVPQNVNFAVHWAEVRAFLDEEGVQYRRETSSHPATQSDVAAIARRISVSIDCTE
jgi:hypothetical protein